MASETARARYNVLGGLEARSLDGTGNNLSNPAWGAIDASYTCIADNTTRTASRTWPAHGP